MSYYESQIINIFKSKYPHGLVFQYGNIIPDDLNLDSIIKFLDIEHFQDDFCLIKVKRLPKPVIINYMGDL